MEVQPMREHRRHERRLTRSSDNRVIAGVFGGLAAYLHLSANALRIAYLVISALTGLMPGTLIYILLVLIIPPEHPNPLFSAMDTLRRQSHTDRRQRKELHHVEEHDVHHQND